MLINAFIGAVSTLVLFFLQAKLPLAGLNNALLGPALFIMGLGAAFAFCMTFTGNPYIMILGGFIGSFTFSLVMIVMSTVMGSIMRFAIIIQDRYMQNRIYRMKQYILLELTDFPSIYFISRLI